MPAATLADEVTPGWEWKELNIGDTVAEGTRENLSAPCWFPASTGTITFTPEDAQLLSDSEQGSTLTRGIGTEVVADGTTCLLVVSSITEKAQAGPLPVQTPDPMGTSAQEEDVNDTDTEQGPSTLGHENCKTVRGHIFTHSVFGESDKMTSKTGTLNFCSDGSQAWALDQTGKCETHGPHGFVIDRCVLDSYNAGPTTTVHRQGTGEYHQKDGYPPSGDYNHWLSDRENGHYNGGYSCSFGYGGELPPGPVWECSLVS